MLPLEILSGLAGTVLPAILGLFRKKNGAPEKVVGELAVSKPEALAPYLDGLARLNQSEVALFNRDIAGTPSSWLIDLRGVIRPALVLVSMFCLAAEGTKLVSFAPEIRAFMMFNIGNWLGSRGQLGK